MDIQTLTVVVTGVGVLIAAVNQIYMSRQANAQRQTEIETRQAELFMQMYDRWTSSDFRKAFLTVWLDVNYTDYEDFQKQYGGRIDEYVDTFATQASFYKSIGVLVEQELISIDLVDRLMHNTVIAFWDKMGPYYIETRKKQPQTQGWAPVYYSLENLYNLMKQRQKATVTT